MIDQRAQATESRCQIDPRLVLCQWESAVRPEVEQVGGSSADETVAVAAVPAVVAGVRKHSRSVADGVHCFDRQARGSPIRARADRTMGVHAEHDEADDVAVVEVAAREWLVALV